MRKALALMEKEKPGSTSGIVTTSLQQPQVVTTSLRPNSKENSTKSTDVSDIMSKSGTMSGHHYKRNPSANMMMMMGNGVTSSLNADILSKNFQSLDQDDVRSTAMSNNSMLLPSSGDHNHTPKVGKGAPRIGSGKMLNSMTVAGVQDPAIYELSLNTQSLKVAKPQKLKPLSKNTTKSSNLAISLLEDDKQKPSYLDDMTTMQDLENEMKTYLDTN